VIEKKLPTDTRKEWAKLVSSEDSTVDKMDKFPSSLKFLLNQKQAIEYKNAELRFNNDSRVRGSVFYSEKDDTVAASRSTRSKCLYHERANHWTSECRVYLSKPVEERRETLKEKGACWSCLKRGHRIQECRNNASANMCNNRGIDTCLLQAQRIRTKKGWAKVLWDNGASLCFITNKKARGEKLKGIRAELSIVKVGGVNEKLVSYKYKLTLIDKRDRNYK